MPVLSKPNTLKRVLTAVTFVSLVAAAAAAPDYDVAAVTTFLKGACPSETADKLVSNVINADASTVCCTSAGNFDLLSGAQSECVKGTAVPSLTTVGVVDCTITSESQEKTHCCAYIKAADSVIPVATTCAEGKATLTAAAPTVSPTPANGAGQVLGVSGAVAAAAALSIVAAVL